MLKSNSIVVWDNEWIKGNATSFITFFSEIILTTDFCLLFQANPTNKTKNMFSHYQLPSLDRRGAGF